MQSSKDAISDLIQSALQLARRENLDMVAYLLEMALLVVNDDAETTNGRNTGRGS